MVQVTVEFEEYGLSLFFHTYCRHLWDWYIYIYYVYMPFHFNGHNTVYFAYYYGLLYALVICYHNQGAIREARVLVNGYSTRYA